MLDGNPGFGAASNAGVAAARHAVTVLLNPDCELLDAGLSALAARAAGGEALLVPRLIEADGAAAAQRAPAARAARWRSCAPRCPRARCPSPTAPADRGAWAGPSPPAWRRRPRCCVAWAPSTPSAFLFYEDMDLCLRARAAGVPTVLHPEVVVRHLGGRSTARAFGGEAFDLQARRRREVVGARLGARALRYDDGAQALTFGLRAAVGRERGRNMAALRALRAARRMATAARR